MELAWIEDFLALHRTQNFTEAALQRCTTQPAFSRRVQQLEEWLGTMLFDRATRPVQLTEGGIEFLRRAQRIREDILDARRILMMSPSHYRQSMRIYCTTSVAIGILPRYLKNLGDLDHSILTSSTSGCLEALRQKRADRILLPWFADEEMDAQLQYEKIADDPIIPVESAQAKKTIILKDKKLSGPLLMYAPSTIFGQQIARHLAALDIVGDRNTACEGLSAETLLALAGQGLGAAWVPQSMIQAGIKRCSVPRELDVPCEIMLITRRG